MQTDRRDRCFRSPSHCADFSLCRLPHQRDLGVGQDTLARCHFADEVARLDEVTWVALDEFARDTKSIDAEASASTLAAM